MAHATTASSTACSNAPSATTHSKQPLRPRRRSDTNPTDTTEPGSVSEVPSTTIATESTASALLADRDAAAQQHLSKLDKTSAGFVSERLLLQTAWKFMSECDKYKVFAKPVSAKDAPDYSDTIKKKMALSNMQTKVKHGNYGTLEAFGKDIQLIVDNCNLYNAGILYYTEQADEFLAAWKIYYEKAIVLRKDQLVVPPSLAAPSSTTVTSGSASEATNPVAFRGSLTDSVVQSTAQVQTHPANNRGTTVLGKLPRDNPVNNNNNNSSIVQAGWPVTPRTLQALPDPFVLSRLEMKSLVRVVTDSEYVRPFWGTNDKSMVQGRPMGFATLRSNISCGAYDHSAVPFVADIRFIWENGVKCNRSDSDIALNAVKLGEQFETQLGLVLDQMKKERQEKQQQEKQQLEKQQQEKQQQEEEKNKKRTPVVAAHVPANEQHSNVARSGNLQMRIHPPTIGAKRSETPAVVTEKANKAPRVLPTSFTFAGSGSTQPATTVPPASAPATAPVSTRTERSAKANTPKAAAPKAASALSAGAHGSVPVPIYVVSTTITPRPSAPTMIPPPATATATASATVPATLPACATAPTDDPAPTPAAVPVTAPSTVTTDTNTTAVPAAVPAAVPLDTQVEILKFLTQHGDETFKKDAMRQLLALATQR